MIKGSGILCSCHSCKGTKVSIGISFLDMGMLLVLFHNSTFKIKKCQSSTNLKKLSKLVLKTIVINYGFNFKLKTVVTNYCFDFKKFKTANYGFDEDTLVWVLF